MRLSVLAERTDVPVATLKYYLREGLLHPGTSLSRTQAAYDESHVDRVRLVRALTEVGGLSLATVGRVLTAIAMQGENRLEVLGAAQRSLFGVDHVQLGEEAMGRPDFSATRAGRWLAWMGWQVDPADPVVEQLDRAWAACDDARIGVDEERLSAYAEAVLGVARVDLDAVPDDPESAVRQVVLGTLLLDPVLAALRRLAQQHLAVSTLGPVPDSPSGDQPG